MREPFRTDEMQLQHWIAPDSDRSFLPESSCQKSARRPDAVSPMETLQKKSTFKSEHVSGGTVKVRLWREVSTPFSSRAGWMSEHCWSAGGIYTRGDQVGDGDGSA